MQIMLVCYITKSVNLETFFVTFSYQQTPLHVAASNGRDYTVECLVKKGADINMKDESGVCETILLMIVL